MLDRENIAGSNRMYETFQKVKFNSLNLIPNQIIDLIFDFSITLSIWCFGDSPFLKQRIRAIKNGQHESFHSLVRSK